MSASLAGAGAEWVGVERGAIRSAGRAAAWCTGRCQTAGADGRGGCTARSGIGAAGFVSGARTMEPRTSGCVTLPRATALELLNGTSSAAIRSTVEGNGSERPAAARTGTGSATASTVRSRAETPLRPQPGIGRTSSAIAAVIGMRPQAGLLAL
jgi:hypothetical protein